MRCGLRPLRSDAGPEKVTHSHRKIANTDAGGVVDGSREGGSDFE